MLQILDKIRINREHTIVKDRPAIEPLAAVNPAAYSDEASAYFAHYGLDCESPDTEHLFGSFQSAGFTLAAHLYQPAQYQATVVLFHGYLNHTGQFKNLIPFLLKNQYAVAVFDLPGHGLSSGRQAEIDSFDQYITVTQDFLNVIKTRLKATCLPVFCFSLSSKIQSLLFNAEPGEVSARNMLNGTRI